MNPFLATMGDATLTEKRPVYVMPPMVASASRGGATEQHIFGFSMIIEGATEKVFQF